MNNKAKNRARVVGALFIIAIVASIVGGSLIDSILTADYLASIPSNGSQVVLGVLLELVNGLAVIGIAVLMFPFLKKHDEGLALGYVALRIIEAVIAIAAVISPLTLILLSQEYSAAGAVDASFLQMIGSSFIAARAQLVGQLLGIFFSLAALLFYYLLYQTRLVPRFISVWGLIGVASVLTWNLLKTFGIQVSFGMILALPIILNELFLGIWLMVKGFESPVTESEPVEAVVKAA